LRSGIPSPDHPTLSFAYRDVVADHDELDLIGFFSVLRGVLLGSEAKVEDVAGIVSVAFLMLIPPQIG
jgi:hypothetical protein